MYEANGWCTIAESPGDVDVGTLVEGIDELRLRLAGLSWPSLVVALNCISGTWTMSVQCCTNRRRTEAETVDGLFRWVAQRFPGSWGLIYERNDDLPEDGGGNEFPSGSSPEGASRNGPILFCHQSDPRSRTEAFAPRRSRAPRKPRASDVVGFPLAASREPAASLLAVGLAHAVAPPSVTMTTARVQQPGRALMRPWSARAEPSPGVEGPWLFSSGPVRNSLRLRHPAWTTWGVRGGHRLVTTAPELAVISRLGRRRHRHAFAQLNGTIREAATSVDIRLRGVRIPPRARCFRTQPSSGGGGQRPRSRDPLGGCRARGGRSASVEWRRTRSRSPRG